MVEVMMLRGAGWLGLGLANCSLGIFPFLSFFFFSDLLARVALHHWSSGSWMQRWDLGGIWEGGCRLQIWNLDMVFEISWLFILILGLMALPCVEKSQNALPHLDMLGLNFKMER